MDRLLLLVSTLAFMGGLIHAVVALRAGQWREARWQWVPIAIGFVFQSTFLYLRGQKYGRCPLTNVFEVLIFIGWGIVLLYFLVGSTFRLSLLGMFTAPMIALLQGVSLVAPLDRTGSLPRSASNPWGEMHAAVSLLAYAAFAMACVTGIMYLVQARMLKKHNIHGLFFQLPPIHELAKAIQRLVFWGVVLLSAGLACSWPLKTPVSNPKLVVSWIVWVFYSGMALVMWRHALPVRRTAWLAVLGFLVPLISLWVVTKA